ncbi:unnamed protein product [Alopecurus aequalis]
MGSSGSGSGSGLYLDPELVYAFVRSNRPRDLFRYLNSVPGATADLHCRLASFAGTALLAPRLGSPPWPDEESWALYWARYARAHALMSRFVAGGINDLLKPNYREAVGSSRRTTIPDTFITSTLQKLCGPQVAGNPFGYPSDPVGRHAAIINQLEASSSSTPTAMLPPQQTNYNVVFNFPITPAPTLDGIAFNLGRHASNFAPWGTDSTLELAFRKLSLGQPGSEQMTPQELMQNNPAMGLLSLGQPGSEQMAPQRLMQNREVDIKGKRPASEVDEQKVLVRVATLMAKDSTTGAAGLLIKKGPRQFICASCFPMLATEPVLLAAACCEGIKIARAYQPSTIVVESHLFHLLIPYLAGAHLPCPEMEELKKLLDPSRCTLGGITKECNSTACQLALYSFTYRLAEIFFGALPERVFPYLACSQDQ